MIKSINLKYNFSDLEPYIDSKTIEIHHTKHHQAYINNLNVFLEKEGINEEDIIEVLKLVSTIEGENKTPINNNAGGVYLHNLYFEQFSPAPKAISGKLLEKVNKVFGSFEEMINTLKQKAMTQFGSGWSALALNKNTKELEIIQIANQDIAKYIDQNIYPIVVLDVWEHAYYLKYQNRRADYLDEIVKIIDWEKVEEDFLKI